MRQYLRVLLSYNMLNQLSDPLLAIILQEGWWDFRILVIGYVFQLADAVDKKLLMGRATVPLSFKHRLNDWHVELPEVLILDFVLTLNLQNEHEQIEDLEKLSSTASEAVLNRIEDTALLYLLEVNGSENIESFENVGIVD